MGWIYNAPSEVQNLSKYPTIIAVCIVLVTLSTVVVSTRLLLHARTRQLATDDYVSAGSMIFSIIYSSLCITQTRYGLGLPLNLRPRKNLTTYTRVNFAGRPFYQIGILGFKVALCISYLRLLSGTDRKVYKAIIWIAMSIIAAGHIAGTLVLILSCHPVEKSWTPSIRSGWCFPFAPTNYGLASFTIASDITVALLPIPLLVGLNIRTSHKIGLCMLFTLGILTTICSIFRLLQINTIAYGDGNSTLLVLWGTIEFNVGNVLSSLPFLAPLVLRKVDTLRTRLSGSGRGGSGRGWSSTDERYSLQLVPGGQQAANTTDVKKSPDKTPSEEMILSERWMHNEGSISIVKTVGYRVEVDEGNESEGVDKKGVGEV